MIDPETDAGKAGDLVRIYVGTSEMPRPHHFASVYMGKHYDHGHTEILSRGMASILVGTIGGVIGGKCP